MPTHTSTTQMIEGVVVVVVVAGADVVYELV